MQETRFGRAGHLRGRVSQKVATHKAYLLLRMPATAAPVFHRQKGLAIGLVREVSSSGHYPLLAGLRLPW